MEDTSHHRNAVAVIPARGGSRGIPRKNTRLMAGKPLLAYSIEAARAASCFSSVYVSTDDDEVAEIARRFGAEVIRRSPGLAGDAVTLDAVIVDACEQLARRHPEGPPRFVATIQPTSPLLTPRTIREAVERCITGGADTVLTVIDEPHLAWTRRDGTPVPLYASRVNRQQLPPYLRETGGVVVCPTGQLASGTRFGHRIEALEISKEEAIDIDDYYDWWLAEKVLRRKRILFHVVGSRESGLGHVYRALTLTYRLPAHQVSFLVGEPSRLAAEILERSHQQVAVVGSGDEPAFILEESPDLLVNDVLDTSESFMAAIRSAGITSVNFEDRGPGSVYADVLVNAMYDEGFRTRRPNAYDGVEYCCLRDEFYSIEPRPPAAEVRRILVLFGGTDPSNLTSRCLGWLDRASGPWSITVVVGPGYGDFEQLERLAGAASHEIVLVRDTNVISKHMAEADLAVTSAGRTVFELAALGVPMIVIAQNEREEHHAFATSTPGAIYLGPARNLSSDHFCESLRELLSGRLLRRKMHEALCNSDIRGGIGRVLRLIEDLAAGTGRE